MPPRKDGVCFELNPTCFVTPAVQNLSFDFRHSWLVFVAARGEADSLTAVASTGCVAEHSKYVVAVLGGCVWEGY